MGFWYNYFVWIPNWILQILFIAPGIFASYFTFIFAITFISKLFIIIIKLIYKPKEGIFIAEEGKKDFEFWCLRTEVKKLVLWFMNNFPLPWIDTWGFRWFGVNVDFTSHMFDAWLDIENIKFGRKVTVGQGAVVMSSMVVGKYLIIRKVLFDDYVVIGGVSNIAPGTKVGKETIIGAFSNTAVDQILDPGWIYFGIPVTKLKPNKFSDIDRRKIVKKIVDDQIKYTVKHGNENEVYDKIRDSIDGD
jgi:carbonic anhydrase/acetyltransferase-like protein (isoleucine patch superfamily)